MQATARIFFQTAPAKKTANNLCPVKLCITHKRERKYYSIVERLKNNDWAFISDEADKEGKSDIDKITSDSPRGKYRDIAFEYKRIVEVAESIIKNLPVFSFNQFEERFFNKVTSWDNVFAAIWSHIQDLKNEKRFGYASSFESTLRAIKEFHTGKSFDFNPRANKVETRANDYLNGKPLNFVDITPSWLKRFENWMQESGKSKSTIGIYVRNIRVVFNLAIKDHKVKAEYPFDKHTPKSASGRKIALTALQISLIANYGTEHPQEQFYRDMFMFSFLGNGMNLSDIARLKYSDISDNEIYFVREKSKNENHKEVEIRVPVTKTIQNFISKHGNKAIGFDAYIFPVLKPEWNEARNYAEIKQFTKQVNKYVRRVALAVGITENISSYSARHSFATISKNSGTSTEFIKEALGHSSVSVTENYLKSFEKSTRVEHSEAMESKIFNQNAG
jgi:integrase